MNDKIAISKNSPRLSGEKAANSDWQEVKYSVFSKMTYRQRLELCEQLSEIHEAVHYRLSIVRGHARIFVKG